MARRQARATDDGQVARRLVGRGGARAASLDLAPL